MRGLGSRLDPFTLIILLSVVAASVVPCRGMGAEIFEFVTDLAIGLLFFLYGARLSRATVWSGMKQWRLHLLVLAHTFVLFPLLGLLFYPLSSTLLPAELQSGLFYLCAVPSTVQSSIALTALARGNVATAICSASASSLLGVALTPLLVQALSLNASGNLSFSESVGSLVAQLILPFCAGQVLHSRLGGALERHKVALRFVDRGAIVLVVYTAFSKAVVAGLWKETTATMLAFVLLFVVALLALALLLTWFSSRLMGFARADEIVVVFCGSKKSLASGVPFANVLFPSSAVGPIVLPLMLYHQLQLLVCTAIAQRYGRRPASEGDASLAS